MPGVHWEWALLAAAMALTANPRVATAQSAVENQIITVLATAQSAPPRITLDWPRVGKSGGFTVYRKTMEAGSWGEAHATLPPDADRFEDNNVVVGVGYEYKVRAANGMTTSRGQFPVEGFVYSGIALPPADNRGAVLLLVDATLTAPLAGELARLEQDLTGDGWIVRRRDVARQSTNHAPGKPAEIEPVKAVIREVIHTAPSALRAVFLLGRVPIPYSGWLSPDGHGHTPRVADTYYAVPDETWTDAKDYGVGNMAGDGIYDQSTFLAGNVRAAVGRVDMSGMPFFGLSETELLRRYLNKLHAYRHRRTVFQPLGGAGAGGLVGCRTGFTLKTLFGRGMARIEGLKSQWDGEYLAPSLWRYQEGLSYNQHALGEKLSERNTQYVFAGCWGSGTINYDEPADGGRMAVGRAYLAGIGAGLAWVCGVPDRHFHWMAMGEPIGTCERLCMANGTLYPSGANGNLYDRVFRGLLGDPTLRMHILAPPAGLTISADTLSWEASPEAGSTGFLGYHVYRSLTGAGPFERLTVTPVPETSWTDSAPLAEAVYQVRAIRLETSTTGSYHNNSQGIFASRHAVGITPEYLWVAVPYGLTAPLRVRLSAAPAAAATINATVTAGASNIAIRSGASLTFTPANWDVWQTVTLGTVPGRDADEIDAAVALTSPGLAGVHVGVVRPAAAIRVSSQSLSVPKDGTAHLLVRLSSPPVGPAVTVSARCASRTKTGTGIAILGDADQQFTHDNWDVWRTLTVIDIDGGSGGMIDIALDAPGYRGITVAADRSGNADETSGALTAYAGFGGAAVTPLGVTPVTEGTPVPLTATAAPGFRFFRWVAPQGSVAFADPMAAHSLATVSGSARIMAVFERGGATIPDVGAPNDNRAPIVVAPVTTEAPVMPLTGGTVRIAASDPDGDPLTYAWSLAVGAGSATFAAPNAAESRVTFSTAGTYVLRATVADGRGGRVAGEATVIAVTPPAIARQPADAAAVAGQTVKLNALATGAFLSYQWFKNGEAMPTVTDRVCLTPPLTAADQGATFTLEVTNPAGSIRSREATLRILDGPPGGGLDGEYFGDADFTQLVTLRTDSELNGDLARPEGISPPYSVRWTGMLMAPHSGRFTFYAHNGQSGGRLWIDDRLVCAPDSFRNGGSILLEAGKKHRIKLELVCNRNDTAYLQWNSETLDLPLRPEGYPSVPAAYLYSEFGGKPSAPRAVKGASRYPELP